MFFQFQVFLYSLIFFVILEFLSSDWAGSGLVFLSVNSQWLAGIIFIALSIYFYQIAKRISRRVSMTPMPLVFTASSMGMLYFVQSEKQENLLIILASVAYYFIHLAFYRLRHCHKDQTALGIIAAGSLATVFVFYASSYGIYLNFAIGLWLLMFVLAIVTTLISFQYFWLISENKQNVLNYSLVLGLVMAEIVWVLNFWPFGYLTTGVINLIFYYVFWDLVQCHFRSALSKRRVIVNMVFFGFLVALVLSSTRWLPVV
ncbi:MAG: hypothetical protein ACD_14C00051G0004 [uncultured bacterium]|nr:MAG: hypothetical protein ACD_14C00051G0004 [uncultured bacterium]KKQ43685.1 MAG: hypothetical protein US63_C0047G0002 [Candidatus Moranbacteria bacterium GW2011_GWC2_37_8]KKQ81160.1 MAG: hypothetical protein UT03_C0010G0015 [Candidatus Moranbacteria bacterium GW2011_GWD2_38_7]